MNDQSSRRNLYISFFIVLVLFGAGALVTSNLNPKSKEDGKVSRKVWLRGLKQLLPRGICTQPSFMLSCYELSAKDCLSEAQLAHETCVQSLWSHIPIRMTPKTDGTEWGRKMGLCTLGEMQETLKDKRSREGACVDERTWAKAHPPRTVTKASYMFNIEQGFPLQFCQPNSPLRECYSLSEEACLKETSEAIDLCLREMEPQIPASITVPIGEMLWGSRLGHCLVHEVEQKLKTSSRKKCRWEEGAP